MFLYLYILSNDQAQAIYARIGHATATVSSQGAHNTMLITLILPKLPQFPGEGADPTRCAMGCAPGHCVSPFRRFGTIYGVPDAACGLCFDISHQQLHQMTSRLSLVSSHELAEIWHLSTAY